MKYFKMALIFNKITFKYHTVNNKVVNSVV